MVLVSIKLKKVLLLILPLTLSVFFFDEVEHMQRIVVEAID